MLDDPLQYTDLQVAHPLFTLIYEEYCVLVLFLLLSLLLR